MFNFKEMLPFIKQPYAAGIICCMWIGLMAFVVIDPALPIIKMTAMTIAASLIIAIKGIRT